jgi:CBS domain-containing protein
MLVKDVMTKREDLAVLPQMATIREVLKVMRDKKIKSVIMDKSNPNGAYGLLTFKNLLQTIVAEDGDIDLLNIYDIASAPAISISQNIDIKYAAKLMVNSSIKRLLVIDNNELKGILSMSDIIGVLMQSVENS